VTTLVVMLYTMYCVRVLSVGVCRATKVWGSQRSQSDFFTSKPS